MPIVDFEECREFMPSLESKQEICAGFEDMEGGMCRVIFILFLFTKDLIKLYDIENDIWYHFYFKLTYNSVTLLQGFCINMWYKNLRFLWRHVVNDNGNLGVYTKTIVWFINDYSF